MIVSLNTDNTLITRVKTALQHGEIVAFPTDTVYGFAVDGRNQKAMATLFRIKRQRKGPFTFFLAQKRLIDYAYSAYQRITDHFIPGALTIVLKKKPGVTLPFVDKTIGIRIPNTPFLLKLLEQYDNPLAVTSANHTGEKPLVTAFEIAEHFTEIPLVINGGTLISQASTVLDCTQTPPTIRRKGVISILNIEEVYQDFIRIDPSIRFNVLFVCTGNSCRSPMAEAILRTLTEPDHCDIRSAGTLAITGMPASERAQVVVQEHGGTLTHHQAQLVTPALIIWADVIFVMAHKHKEYVQQLVPNAKNKISLLKAYKHKKNNTEIADPVGLDLEAYRNTAHEMLPTLRQIAKDIEQRYTGVS